MLNNWFLAIRPKTLPASIAPVLLGSALAVYDGVFQLLVFLLAMSCAVLLQVSVNLANDLFDARSGVDNHHRLGPIRVVQQGLISPRALTWGVIAASFLAVITGLILIYLSSWYLLVFGILCVLAVFSYSAGPWPLASHGVGELAVFLFFGWLAVAGSYFVQTLQLTVWVMGYATVVGLLGAAIMLVNNIRDISTDSMAGKITLAVRLGEVRSKCVYRCFLLSAVFLHGVLLYPLGSWSYASLVFMALYVVFLIGKINIRCGRQLNLQLEQTAQMELFYCVVVGAFLVFA